MIEQGDRAPDFELPDQDGRAVKLSDYKGTPVVVYFYPKAARPAVSAVFTQHGVGKRRSRWQV